MTELRLPEIAVTRPAHPDGRERIEVQFCWPYEPEPFVVRRAFPVDLFAGLRGVGASRLLQYEMTNALREAILERRHKPFGIEATLDAVDWMDVARRAVALAR